MIHYGRSRSDNSVSGGKDGGGDGSASIGGIGSDSGDESVSDSGRSVSIGVSVSGGGSGCGRRIQGSGESLSGHWHISWNFDNGCAD